MREFRQYGFSLVELAIVLVIFSVMVAALALGPPTAESQAKVDRAAQEVAMAIRYARREAIRAGEERGNQVLVGEGRVYAAEADLTSGNVALDTILRNPLDKRDFDFHVGELPGGEGVEITNSASPFTYQGLAGTRNVVVFDAAGYPYFLKDGVRHSLTGGSIELRHGSAERSVAVSPVGRVTVQ